MVFAPLLARFFSGPDDTNFYLKTKWAILNSPASRPAYNLICNMAGLDHSVRDVAEKSMRLRSHALALQRLSPAARAETPQEAGERAHREYLATNPGPDHEHSEAETFHQISNNNLREYQRQLSAIEAANKARLFATRVADGGLYDDSWMGACQPVSKADLHGSGPWPESAERRGAYRFFQDDLEPGHWSPEHSWQILPEDQKAVYRARADALRREAWAEFEMKCVAWGPWTPGSVRCISGFEYFRDSLEAEADFREALRRWEAFTEEERRVWENSARRAWGDGRHAAELAKRATRNPWEAGGVDERRGGAAWRARMLMARGPAADQVWPVQDAARELSRGKLS